MYISSFKSWAIDIAHCELFFLKEWDERVDHEMKAVLHPYAYMASSFRKWYGEWEVKSYQNV